MYIAPWPVHLDVDDGGNPVLVSGAAAGDLSLVDDGPIIEADPWVDDSEFETDRTPPTVAPAVVDQLGGLPVRTPALRPGLL